MTRSFIRGAGKNLFWLPAIFYVFYFASGPGVANAGEKRWITQNGAKLKAGKTASSDTIATLPGGIEVEIISSEKRWYQVSAKSGQSGWVYRGKLLSEPPGDMETETDLIGDLADSGISLDAADTSRSIRGKSKSRQFALNKEAEKTYTDALETVLSYYIGDSEVDEFLKAGKIGEYSE